VVIDGEPWQRDHPLKRAVPDHRRNPTNSRRFVEQCRSAGQAPIALESFSSPRSRGGNRRSEPVTLTALACCSSPAAGKGGGFPDAVGRFDFASHRRQPLQAPGVSDRGSASGQRSARGAGAAGASGDCRLAISRFDPPRGPPRRSVRSEPRCARELGLVGNPASPVDRPLRRSASLLRPPRRGVTTVSSSRWRSGRERRPREPREGGAAGVGRSTSRSSARHPAPQAGRRATDRSLARRSKGRTLFFASAAARRPDAPPLCGMVRARADDSPLRPRSRRERRRAGRVARAAEGWRTGTPVESTRCSTPRGAGRRGRRSVRPPAPRQPRFSRRRRSTLSTKRLAAHSAVLARPDGVK